MRDRPPIDRGAKNNARQQRALQQLVRGAFVPVGGAIIWTDSPADPPSGWLIADGSTVSRTVYADLFRLIGVSFGVGDGSTTFNLPNLTQVDGLSWILRAT